MSATTSLWATKLVSVFLPIMKAKSINLYIIYALILFFLSKKINIFRLKIAFLDLIFQKILAFCSAERYTKTIVFRASSD
jgi:hypothetical protein